MEIDFQWLGRISFEEAFALQERLVEERRLDQISDTILLLEHDPVYTIGRTRNKSSLRADEHPLPHPVVEINRGGQATYHGPGQLVGYFILNLENYGKDLHALLRTVEEVLIRLCGRLGIDAGRQDGLTGVWIDGRKVASIGIGVRRWVSMHGFAINVCGDLTAFNAITPCGIDGVTMTSLALESEREEFSVRGVAQEVERLAPEVLAELRTPPKLA